MKIYAGGREVNVPTQSGKASVADVKNAAGIPQDRMLIQQKTDGGNTILNQNGEVDLNHSNRFMDAPHSKRGGV